MNNALLWFIALILSIVIFGGLNIVQVLLHYREKEELFKKFMSRNLADYQAQTKALDVELEDEKKRLADKREAERKKTPIDKIREAEASKF